MWPSIMISLNDPDDVMAGVTKIRFVIHKQLLALLRTFYYLKIDHARFTAHPFKVTSFFGITTTRGAGKSLAL
jgi:hypothetical protein